MRTLLLAIALLGAGVGDRVATLNREYAQAKENKDYATARARLEELGSVLNGRPGVLWAQADIDALTGKPADAFAKLKKYTGSGLFRDPAEDPDLKSLLSDPRMSEIRAALEHNRQPVEHARTVATLSERDLVTEDIAWDDRTQRFLISSVRRRKIVSVAPDGSMRDFVRSGQDGIDAMLAIRTDPEKRRLWATTAFMPPEEGYKRPEHGRTALLSFDLDSGKLLARYDLPCTAPECVLGDMTTSSRGDVYVTDSVKGGVYRLVRDGSKLDTLIEPGILFSPQTPALVLNERVLLIADYVLGIGRFDLQTRQLTWIENEAGTALNGIDGLYRAGDTLIAVQNGTNPPRVVRLSTDRDFRRVTAWTALESNSAQLGDPTHGVLRNDAFYFLGQSGWGNFDDDGNLKPGAKFEPPRVLSVK